MAMEINCLSGDKIYRTGNCNTIPNEKFKTCPN